MRGRLFKAGVMMCKNTCYMLQKYISIPPQPKNKHALYNKNKMRLGTSVNKIQNITK